MTFLVRVAAHPDPLVSLLCEELATPVDGVFSREVVAVPTRGIERWLTQRIASGLPGFGMGDGICANVEFPSPRRLVRDVLLTVPTLEESVTAWQDPELTAHVTASIDANLDEPWMRLLARYLGADEPERSSPSRLTAARKISRLYSAYARRRPDMIRSWAVGDDVGSDSEPLPDGDLWQPRLWRSLRERVGVAALPELMPAALDPLRAGVVGLDLPQRLAVYGLSAIDPLDLLVLQAIGQHRDVHLYVLHPSPALWDAVRALTGASKNDALVARADDDSEALANHPLLKVWGRDSRELQLVLADSALSAKPVEEPAGASGSLLGRLQGDIRDNRAPVIAPDLCAAVECGADRSIQIHVCHGARRQAEVMRDAVLHVLAADDTLEPRDVVIMTPDLETFAPLLEAAFPSTESDTVDGLPDLRLRIADRAPAVTNPLVRITADLLSVADGRLEAGVVRELIARPVVQQRFGLETDTTSELIRLIDDATIAWGLDSAERETWGAGTNDERTWIRGLDRIMAGVFYADDRVRVVEDTAPMDGDRGRRCRHSGNAGKHHRPSHRRPSVARRRSADVGMGRGSLGVRAAPRGAGMGRRVAA
jgi:exodeoxyribonuclease V gamma subunit